MVIAATIQYFRLPGQNPAGAEATLSLPKTC